MREDGPTDRRTHMFEIIGVFVIMKIHSLPKKYLLLKLKAYKCQIQQYEIICVHFLLYIASYNLLNIDRVISKV